MRVSGHAEWLVGVVALGHAWVQYNNPTFLLRAHLDRGALPASVLHTQAVRMHESVVCAHFMLVTGWIASAAQ